MSIFNRKMYFRLKNVTRNEEEPFIMIKVSIHQKDKILIHMNLIQNFKLHTTSQSENNNIYRCCFN